MGNIYTWTGAIYTLGFVATFAYIYGHLRAGDDFGWSRIPTARNVVQERPELTAVLLALFWPLLVWLADFRQPGWGLRVPEFDQIVYECDGCGVELVVEVHHDDNEELQCWNADRKAQVYGWVVAGYTQDNQTLCQACKEQANAHRSP